MATRVIKDRTTFTVISSTETKYISYSEYNDDYLYHSSRVVQRHFCESDKDASSSWVIARQ